MMMEVTHPKKKKKRCKI